jgi:uncharacterized protein YcfJ
MRSRLEVAFEVHRRTIQGGSPMLKHPSQSLSQSASPMSPAWISPVRRSPALFARTLALPAAAALAATLALGGSSRLALAAAGGGTVAPSEGIGVFPRLHEGRLSMRAPAPGAERDIWLADNVVVAPTPVPQAAPAQAPVVATVNQPPVSTSSTVVETPRSNKVVHVDVSQPHNYMTTIAVSALMGAVAGGLVGGAVYFLGDRNHAENIAYWAAGGVLVGSGVGLVQILTEESRASEATALRKLPTDPAPTLRLALLRTHF